MHVAWISANETGPRLARVQVIPLNGGESAVVVAAQKVDEIKHSLAWSHDSQHLYVAGAAGAGQEELLRVRRDGGPAERTGIVVRGTFGAIRVHPHGGRIAFTRVIRGKQAIWMLENFLPTRN
jgi:hypothetical protein